MNLILDLGNSRIKLAVFQDDELLESSIVKQPNLVKEIAKRQNIYTLENVIVSSVGKVDLTKIKFLQSFKKVIVLDHTIGVPFKNKYKTPKTLGVDRIALIAAASHQFPKKNVLVIDAGTCVTYDFINKKNEYFGGSISPGINMRYQALSTFTANLPKLKIDKFSLIGKDTKTSIHSGVLNGLLNEIDGIIAEYQDKYSNLTIVLTGGDTNFLAKKLKSSIFANPNFLLEGLNSILIHNKDE